MLFYQLYLQDFVYFEEKSLNYGLYCNIYIARVRVSHLKTTVKNGYTLRNIYLLYNIILYKTEI